MKTQTLHQKALLYDRDCPMCSLYTGYFVNSGILGENGRIPFDEINTRIECQIDKDRARHEIALIDYTGGRTMYGLEGLFHIVGTKAPILKPLFRFKPFQWMMKGVYMTITYNRRMMAGKAGTDTCKPDYNLPWRMVYLGLALLIAIPLFYLAGAALLGPELAWAAPAAIAGALLAQTLVSLRLAPQPRMDYLGNLATLLIISALATLPAPLISALNGVPIPWMYIGLLAVGQFLMHRGHFRRLASFELPKALGWTWLTALGASAAALAFILA